jgi:hypothetical protein
MPRGEAAAAVLFSGALAGLRKLKGPAADGRPKWAPGSGAAHGTPLCAPGTALHAQTWARSKDQIQWSDRQLTF